MPIAPFPYPPVYPIYPYPIIYPFSPFFFRPFYGRRGPFYPRHRRF